MLVSLNDLVSILSSRVGQAWNTDLQEEMKVVLNYKRANFFKKLINDHPFQRRFFTKTIEVPLQRVDKAECSSLLDCEVLRSVSPLPAPVRTDDVLFDFVGSPDQELAYRYATPDQYSLYRKYNKYTGSRPAYDYTNNYLYIYGDLETEEVTVRGIWSDPRELLPFKCNNQICYSDDDKYEVPDDLINDMITDTLRVELRIQMPQKGEVEIDNQPN